MSFIINPEDKFYPEHNVYMWTYCTFLGKFTDSDGRNIDLGVLIDDDGKLLDASVYGPEDYSYTSGQISHDWRYETREWCIELYRRIRILNIMKEFENPFIKQFQDALLEGKKKKSISKISNIILDILDIEYARFLIKPNIEQEDLLTEFIEHFLSDDYDKQVQYNILTCLCFYIQTGLSKKLARKFRTLLFNPENETK